MNLHEPIVRAILRERAVSGFQLRATRHLIQSLGLEGGTCITAGTGAGKTLAVYLPVLTYLLGSKRVGSTSVVAVYPRTELLRDQMQTLLTLLKEVDMAYPHDLRVGVLYGASPYDRQDAENHRYRNWKTHRGDFVCPIIGCINDGCEGEYIWPISVGEDTLLRCATCGHQLKSLIFARQKLIQQPPAILFTTTEMINRNLSSALRPLFVGDAQHTPDLILLDEIHTYSGTHGAQVANLLRRWQGEMRQPCHLVGLSATLADPADFFARLIGSSASKVHVVKPEDNEMQETGREYFLAIRGDPASKSALLSTTIQTAMLLRRMMDAERGRPSNGVFGTRLFAFTDSLDLVNRLYSQLLDAEGWYIDNNARKPNGSLALLRESGDDQSTRDRYGQLWDAAEALGTLHRTVRVGRTSSQDQGVDRDSDIVVATASLEVGFDDPDVGAILQHKAPRGAAQFLQRRGRAGRDPSMRPWTGIVLSDYGRDRIAFQSYDSLFEPLIRASRLPVANRVVHKMQAAWWIMDYLRLQTGEDVRRLLSRPPDSRHPASRWLLEAATDLLTEDGLRRLHANLKHSLRISDREVEAVLWEHPRALVTAVIPSIIRRLSALEVSSDVYEGFAWLDAMWEFVPSSLFAPLQIPEVRIRLPKSSGDVSKLSEQKQSISQTLREFAPGHVSYRFSLKGRRDRMWIQPPGSDELSLSLDTFCSDSVPLDKPAEVDIPIVQPVVLQLTTPSQEIADSSFGRWDWRVAYQSEGEPLSVDIPIGALPSIVHTMSAYTHRHGCPLTIWRFADSFTVNRNTDNEPSETCHRLQSDNEPVSIGFSMDVDGIMISSKLDIDFEHIHKPILARALRTKYFEHYVRNHPVLVANTSSIFFRDWIAQLALCVVAVESHQTSRISDHQPKSDNELVNSLLEAARTVFGVANEESNEDLSEPQLLVEIQEAMNRPGVAHALRECLALLESDVDERAVQWIQERMATTLAAALIDAIQTVCPDIDVNDLCPDLVMSSSDDSPIDCSIWLTEDQPGGTGVIESALDRILEDPRAFWSVVSSVLGPTDGERVDHNLRRYLSERHEGKLQNQVTAIQRTSDLQGTTRAWNNLRIELYKLGIDADQTIISALATRLLRPGADSLVDELVRHLLDLWDQMEIKLGIEVDLRVVAYLAARDRTITDQLTAVIGETQKDDLVVGQIVGLLWARGSALRSSGLQAYNPYNNLLPTERLLFAHVLDSSAPEVDAANPDWRACLDKHLSSHGSAVVICRDDLHASEVIEDMLVIPTTVEVLEFHPRVVGFTRSSAEVQIHVDLRQAQQ